MERIIGNSISGREITAKFMGDGDVRLLINGAHHANEWITSLVIERYYTKNKASKGVCLCLVPQVNPDGVALVTGCATAPELERARLIAANYPALPFPFGWKANIRGVDLNLNYPARWDEAVRIKADLGYKAPSPRDYPGPCPLSEPESRAMADITRAFDPHITISLHTQGEEIYIQGGGSSWEGLAAAVAEASGYKLSKPPAQSSNAGYKDWFVKTFDRPGLTVEAGLGENPLAIGQLEEVYSRCEAIIETACAYRPH